MTGELTVRMVKKAYEQIRSIRREYMMFTSAEQALRIVLNPETHRQITEEFWSELRQRDAGVHQGYYVESIEVPVDKPMRQNARMFGIEVISDETVPEEEVELRAVLVRSWETV